MTTFIRAFALTLALTGFSATTFSGGSSSSSKPVTSAQAQGGTGMPTPMCGPNTPGGCNLD